MQDVMRFPIWRVAVTALFAMAAMCASAPAETIPPQLCTTHENLVDQLSRKYGEKVSASGFDAAGNFLQIFSSEKGSWTIAISIPGGDTCVIAAGDHWEQDRLVAGLPEVDS